MIAVDVTVENDVSAVVADKILCGEDLFCRDLTTGRCELETYSTLAVAVGPEKIAVRILGIGAVGRITFAPVVEPEFLACFCRNSERKSAGLRAHDGSKCPASRNRSAYPR